MASHGMLGILKRRLAAAESEARKRWAAAAEPPAPVDGGLQRAMDEFADYCEKIEDDPDVSSDEKRRAAEHWDELVAQAARQEASAQHRVGELRSRAADADKLVEHAKMLIDEHVAVRLRRLPRAVPVAGYFDPDVPAPAACATEHGLQRSGTGNVFADHALYQTCENLLQYSLREVESRAASEQQILEAKRQGLLPWHSDGLEFLQNDEMSQTQAVCREAMAEVELSMTDFERLYLFISRV
jgi:hypothetical protein